MDRTPDYLKLISTSGNTILLKPARKHLHKELFLAESLKIVCLFNIPVSSNQSDKGVSSACLQALLEH
jgi:hypothetical protein